MWSETWRDVRLAFRTLRNGPMFGMTAVLSLAIGIGGTAVIFGLADAYLIRPWPGIADPAADPALAALAGEMAAEEGVHVAWVQSALRRTPDPVIDWGAIFG